ncbi:MAG: hypothetical protein KKB20_08080 [Proteobacteria bacterium]|nr:hypothetical protein [Pseudomonadota bacterium]
MRETRTIRIGRRAVKIFELTVRDVFDHWDTIAAGGMESVAALLPRLTDLPMKKLARLSGEKLLRFWNAVEEVNAHFFGRAPMGRGLSRKSPAGSRPETTWLAMPAGSSSPDTARRSGTTGSRFFWSPSKRPIRRSGTPC